MILTVWQSMTLTQTMADDPESFYVSVFRMFVAKFMFPQKK